MQQQGIRFRQLRGHFEVDAVLVQPPAELADKPNVPEPLRPVERVVQCLCVHFGAVEPGPFGAGCNQRRYALDFTGFGNRRIRLVVGKLELGITATQSQPCERRYGRTRNGYGVTHKATGVDMAGLVTRGAPWKLRATVLASFAAPSQSPVSRRIRARQPCI